MVRPYTLDITEVNENFETWISQPFISENIKEELRKAQILLIPTIGFRDHTLPTFPVGTEGTLAFLKKNLPNDINVDICINDEDYTELGLYSNWKIIGTFIVGSLVAPIFVNVLSELIKNAFITEEKQSTIQIYTIENSTSNLKNKNSRRNSTHKPHVRSKAPAKHFEKPKLKFSLTIVDSTGKSIKLDYEGPVEHVHEIREEIQKIIRNEN